MSKENNTPFFSLIVPVYSVEKYIEECLDSILQQTYTNFEVLCVIDGSPDNSGEICNKYASQDSRIKVIYQENQGAAAARNTGLENATGEYIHFVDPDDRLPNCEVYSQLHSILKGCQYDVLVGRSNYYHDTFEVKTEVGTSKEIKKENYNSLSFVLENDYFFALTSGVNKIYRRTMIIDNQVFWPLNIVNEDDYWLPRIFNESKNVIFVSFDIYDVRRRAASITSTRSHSRMSRRGQGYMKTALDNIGLLLENRLSKKAIKNGVSYYVQLYYTGFYINRKYGGTEMGDLEVVKHMQYSGNIKMKLMYILSRILGENAVFDLMKRRYKID